MEATARSILPSGLQRLLAACRLASHVLQRPALSRDEKLVSMLVKKLIAVAALEKQAAAIEGLSGTGLPLHHSVIILGCTTAANSPS